ncbi:MAG: hypothetical protein KDB80_00120 [Planctomycetes bacterium]|nr:hypothetical protein [Planctomycetota bacterium]
MVASRFSQLVLAGFVGLSVACIASAQTTVSKNISFADIESAECSDHYAMTQFRLARTVDANGVVSWVGLSETLRIEPTPAGSMPRFDLSLLSSIGLDVAEEQRQQALHAEHRGFLHLYGSFHVHDAALATRNYTLTVEAADVILGRAVRRVSVRPTHAHGGSWWLLDLDVQTDYPLRRIEYAPNGDMVSMLVVTTFTNGLAAQAQTSVPNWWQPPHRTWYPSIKDACLATGVAVRQFDVLPQNFGLHDTSVVIDPITGDHTFISNFTNGVDCVQLLETPNVPAPNLAVAKSNSGYAMFDFSDLNSTQLMFHVLGTQYLVIGSAHDIGVQAFADDTLRAAVR